MTWEIDNADRVRQVPSNVGIFPHLFFPAGEKSTVVPWEGGAVISRLLEYAQ